MLTITEDVFGSTADPFTKKLEPVRRFTFTNLDGIVVQVITLGAIITSIKVPDADGSIDDVALGYDEVAGYTNNLPNPYMGATIGRVANRIGNGCFFLNGEEIKVSKNIMDKFILHGGFIGFSDVLWTVAELSHKDCSVKLQHVSPDGHEGFPGELTTTILFKLTADNCFHVRYNATTTKPTPVNLTNHSYFNLAGHNAGKDALYEHSIYINADKITVTDANSIPTGELQDVAGTPYDFTKLSNLGEHMRQTNEQGFDKNFCLNLDKNGITVIAKAVHPKSGRWMEVATDQPGLQFYTGNNLPNPQKNEVPLLGIAGAGYVRHGSFCFETQGYPDAVNHPNFPSVILNPGETYDQNYIYKFGVISKK